MDPIVSLGECTSDKLIQRPCATDSNAPGSAVQLALNPPHHPLIQSTLPEFAYEDAVRDSVKSLADTKVDNIHCSSLIHSDSCFITEGSGASQV